MRTEKKTRSASCTLTLAHICNDIPSGLASSPLIHTSRNGLSGVPAPASFSARAAAIVYSYVSSVYASLDMPIALLPSAQMSASCSARSAGYEPKSSWRTTSVFSKALAGSSAHAGMGRRVRRVTRWMDGSARAAR